VHEHFSDSELARLVSDPESIPLARRLVLEEETADCATCRTSFDFFSVVAGEDLAELEVWDADTDWSSGDPMRAYIERIAGEDRQADELLAQRKVLSSPTKTAWTDLSRDRKMRTGGVVRRLSAHANKIHLDEPLDALTFADAAISVAEVLPDDVYPWKAVFELRGTAWKERANAMLVLGEYPAALEALTHAERAYRHLSSSGLGLSTVALVRASVLCEQGRLVEALESAEKAEHGFAHIGQEERRMRAVFLRGTIKFETGQIADAVLLFQQVLDYGEDVNDARWVARAAYAIGNCEVDRGDLGEASLRFHKALEIFHAIGPDRERLATEWGLARVVMNGGNRSEAIRRLRIVAVELEKRSMLTDAALVRLDIVETLLALGETKQVVEIAGRLFRLFKDAGKLTGALTALAYMKEAASCGRLSPSGVDVVRGFLRRVERQPNLAFVPPPESFR